VGLAALRLAFIADIAYTYRLYLSRDKVSEGRVPKKSTQRVGPAGAEDQQIRMSLRRATVNENVRSTLDCGREAAALPLAHGPHESRAESGSFATALQSAFGTAIFKAETQSDEMKRPFSLCLSASVVQILFFHTFRQGGPQPALSPAGAGTKSVPLPAATQCKPHRGCDGVRTIRRHFTPSTSRRPERVRKVLTLPPGKRRSISRLVRAG